MFVGLKSSFMLVLLVIGARRKSMGIALLWNHAIVIYLSSLNASIVIRGLSQFVRHCLSCGILRAMLAVLFVFHFHYFQFAMLAVTTALQKPRHPFEFGVFILVFCNVNAWRACLFFL